MSSSHCFLITSEKLLKQITLQKISLCVCWRKQQVHQYQGKNKSAFCLLADSVEEYF